MKYLFIVVLFVLSGNAGRLLAATPKTNSIHLVDSLEEQSLRDVLWFYEDENGDKSLEWIQSNRKTIFSPDSPGYVEHPESTYWLTFQVITAKKTKWVLELMDFYAQDVSVFIPTKDRGYAKTRFGRDHPFWIRPYATSNLAYDLPTFADTSYRVYIRIKSPNQAGFSFYVRSQEYYSFYAINEFYFLGMYYGALALIIIYHLFLFFQTRVRLYITYMLYVLSCGVYSLGESGIGFRFLYPNFPQWNDPIDYLLAPMLLILSYSLYSSNFLRLRDFNRRGKWAIWIAAGIVSLYMVAEYLLPTNLEIINFNLFLVPFFIVYALSFRTYLNGYTFSRYFIAGNTFILASLIINYLRLTDIIPHTIVTVYSFHIAVILESLAFSLAVGERMRFLKIDKEHAQQKVIEKLKENEALQQKVTRELEEKVQERTKDLQHKSIELSQANEELQEMAQKLNAINARLDYQNWQLNKQLVEETRQRINDKSVSYEAFCKAFPDELTCIKFIEELKWGDSFSCSKCKNTGYSILKPSMSRKCKKCGHIESPTANTLFHGLKMPLQKALYITYITFENPKAYTLEQWIGLLDLSKNSIWKLKKKVVNTISQKGFSGWEELILADRGK